MCYSQVGLCPSCNKIWIKNWIHFCREVSEGRACKNPNPFTFKFVGLKVPGDSACCGSTKDPFWFVIPADLDADKKSDGKRSFKPTKPILTAPTASEEFPGLKKAIKQAHEA